MRQQLRQLSGDTAIYGVTTIVQRFLTFLLTPFYTQFLVPAELGRQTSIFAAIAFMMIVANAGMEAAYFKYASAATDDAERRQVFWNSSIVNWLVAGLFAAGIILFPEAFNQITFLQLEQADYHLIRMAGVIIFFDAASMISLAQLRITRRPKVFSAIKIAAIVVNVGLNIWFIAFLDMGIEGVFVANIVQSVVQFLLVLPFVFRMFPATFDHLTADQLLRFGLPTVASGLAAIALQVIDRPIMLNIMGEQGESAVGLYQASFRLGIVMMLFVSVFEFAWRPFFLQQAAKPNARQLYARIFTYFNLAAAFIFLVVSFFIVNVVTARLPFKETTVIEQTYWSGLAIVPIVLAAYIFNGWYTNFIVGIYIEKKTKSLPWITGLGGAIKAGLCFAMIPLMGIAGGAWATLIAYLVMALVLYWYIRKHYTIKYEWGRVAKIAAGAIGVWAVNVLWLDFFDRSWQTAMIRLGLLAGFVVWLFVTGFFDSAERRELARFLPFLRTREST
jgi:O-antigen/teichoic acid export membrane protein